MNYNPLDSDFLWLVTQQTFPALYREALLTSTPTISIREFRGLFVKRIKRSGLKVKTFQEHILLINEKYFVWITQKPVKEERQVLTVFLRETKIARLGYVLRLDEIPEWGCVQISRKHLVQN